MSSSREDALWRAAIEASLRDSRPQNQDVEASSPSAQGEVVDLTFDSDSENGRDLQQIFPKSKSVVGSDTDDEAAAGDDEDLRAAIALSLEGRRQKENKNDDEESTTTKASQQPPKTQEHSQPSGFLGMDRKKMEEERLARLAKRKADDGDNSPRPQPSKAIKTGSNKIPNTHDSDQSLGPHPAKATNTPSVRIPDTHGSEPLIQRVPLSREAQPPPICNQLAANDPNCGVRPTARSVPQWPLGAVKQTAVATGLRQHNDITIEEVLQRGDLEAAVLSSFMLDVNWLLSKVNNWQTPVILVMHAKQEEAVRMQTQGRKLELARHTRLTYPGSAASVGRCSPVAAKRAPMLSSHGGLGQLHALQVDAAVPSWVPSNRCSYRQPHFYRLGRKQPDGECQWLELFQFKPANRFLADCLPN